MFDLELLEMHWKHNNEIRRILKEMRSSFTGRTDESAVKIIAMCDRTEIRMNNDEEEDITKLNLFLLQLMYERSRKENEE